MAAHMPLNPAPITRTFRRLRFSTGSSFKVKVVLPLVVFPPEPFGWAMSSALLCCLWMIWLCWLWFHSVSDGNACAISSIRSEAHERYVSAAERSP